MLVTEIRFLLQLRPGLAILKPAKADSNGEPAMDAKYFREKAEMCMRLADGLSLNNPSRFQLMDLADDFLERAKELEPGKGNEESFAAWLLRQ